MRELVEAARDEDADFSVAGIVEHSARRFGKRGEVTAVEADTHPGMQAQGIDDLDGMGHAFEGVVGVDEEGGAARKIGGEGLERLELGGERLDVAVGHGARWAQSIAPGRLDVAGGGEANHRRHPRRRQSRFDALGTAKAELDQLNEPAPGQPAPGRLGGEGGLECESGSRGSSRPVGLRRSAL